MINQKRWQCIFSHPDGISLTWSNIALDVISWMEIIKSIPIPIHWHGAVQLHLLNIIISVTNQSFEKPNINAGFNKNSSNAVRGFL